MESADICDQPGAQSSSPRALKLPCLTDEAERSRQALVDALVSLQAVCAPSVDASAALAALQVPPSVLKHKHQLPRFGVRLAVAKARGDAEMEKVIVNRLENNRYPDALDEFGALRAESLYVLVRTLRKQLLESLIKDDNGLLRLPDEVSARITCAILAAPQGNLMKVELLAPDAMWVQKLLPALPAAIELKMAPAVTTPRPVLLPMRRPVPGRPDVVPVPPRQTPAGPSAAPNEEAATPLERLESNILAAVSASAAGASRDAQRLYEQGAETQRMVQVPGICEPLAMPRMPHRHLACHGSRGCRCKWRSTRRHPAATGSSAAASQKRTCCRHPGLLPLSPPQAHACGPDRAAFR